MNAISLHQPWASAFALGLKSIETRSWKPPESCIGERFAIASTKRRMSIEQIGRVAALVAAGDEPVYPPLGCVVASGVLSAALPIIAGDGETVPEHPACVVAPSGNLVLVDPVERAWHWRKVTSEKPWGDYSLTIPPRWAWLFSDLARVETRCPRCWGDGAQEGADGWPTNCSVCDGEGSCPPFPVKGKQRVWKWEPEKETV